ncbi:Hypothetical protein MCYN_0589 [Mycoplasmopsis cynos C142]|uniref:Uncharacterized protein n=1 Tax=Mycoplasmopsis cynos (strain C142) TaxID=1246955 RepID=L0RXK4_MYCC1|nr:Hypothetical protein MCYN_0589 [Mycoplasmopsis cynos C142]
MMIPFAGPPIEGLHGIIANLFKSNDTKATFKFIFAKAKVASTPACPPPITIASKLLFLSNIMFLFYQISQFF